MLTLSWPSGECRIGDAQLLDRASQPLGHDACARNARARQQQGEFLAAVTSREVARSAGEVGQKLADPPQAVVAFDVTIAIVEQLEVIDVDHQQPDGRAARLPPCARERFIEGASVGETRERIDRRELLEVLVGGAQFAFALGKLLRHVGEGSRERREFLRPSLPFRARAEIATSEPRRGARQRTDGIDDQPLAADPSDHQHEDSEETEVQVGDLDLAVDRRSTSASGSPTTRRASLAGTCTNP